MAILSEIVRNVLVIIILASFLELLLPEGSLRPFVRFAIGLFILVAVLTPVLGVLFTDHRFQISAWDYQVEDDEQGDIIERGQEINQQVLGYHNNMIQTKLEKQISAMVMLIPGVHEAESKARFNKQGVPDDLVINVICQPLPDDKTGSISEVFSLTPESNSTVPEEDLEKKICRIIENMYGIDVDNIKVIIEGG